MRLFLVPVLVIGAGLTVSACGGDSSPEVPIVVPTQTTTASASSKEDFITQGDAVCEEANAAIAQFAAAGQGLTEADQIADLRQGVVEELNDLGPPDDDRQTLDQFLTGMEQMVEAGKKIALAQDRGEDTAQFEAELEAARSEAETAASAYGFKECGQPISSSGTTEPETGATAAPSEPVAPAPSDPGSVGGTGDTGSGDTGGDTGGETGGTGAGGVGPG
ncbi:MAG: hypothetical protein ACRDL6_12830 [Solirubrobacterales bacterium]